MIYMCFLHFKLDLYTPFKSKYVIANLHVNTCVAADGEKKSE